MSDTPLPRLLAFAIPAVLAAGAVAPYLVDLGYRAFEAEVVIISLGAATVFGAIGALLANWPRCFAGLLAILAYWIADAYFATDSKGVIVALAGAIILYAGLRSRFAANLRPMLLVFGVLWLGSNLITHKATLIEPPLGESHAAGDATLPPIIHIIIDEQMSPTALPFTIPEDHTAHGLLEDYRKLGFDTYEHARSVSHLSRESIGNIMSLNDDSQNFALTKGKFSFHVKDNRYFTALANRGYSLDVVQSTYFGLCTDETRDACHDYSRAGNGQTVSERLDSIPDRIAFALIELHSRMNHNEPATNVLIYRAAMLGLRKLGAPFDSPESYSRTTATLAILDQMAVQLGGIERGKAYVYHLLLPHTPYNLDANCEVKPVREWTRGIGDRLHNRPIAEVYAGYWDQAACTHRRLMELIGKVLAHPIGKEAIIIVHGDHGARLTWEGAPEQNPADMLETFLAIKGPGTSGRNFGGEVNLQAMFRKDVPAMLGIVATASP